MPPYHFAIDGGSRTPADQELEDDSAALNLARHVAESMTRNDGLPHTVVVYRENGEVVSKGAGLVISFNLTPPQLH